jgi:hypothetical protein
MRLTYEHDKAFAARNLRLRIIEGYELSTSSPSTST